MRIWWEDFGEATTRGKEVPESSRSEKSHPVTEMEGDDPEED